jgi:hypothetical protein
MADVNNHIYSPTFDFCGRFFGRILRQLQAPARSRIGLRFLRGYNHKQLIYI